MSNTHIPLDEVHFLCLRCSSCHKTNAVPLDTGKIPLFCSCGQDFFIDKGVKAFKECKRSTAIPKDEPQIMAGAILLREAINGAFTLELETIVPIVPSDDRKSNTFFNPKWIDASR